MPTATASTRPMTPRSSAATSGRVQKITEDLRDRLRRGLRS
jgi:hypothetical protein